MCRTVVVSPSQSKNVGQRHGTEIIVDSVNPAERIIDVLRRNAGQIAEGSRKAGDGNAQSEKDRISEFSKHSTGVADELESHYGLISGWRRFWSRVPYMASGSFPVYMPTLKLKTPSLRTHEMHNAGLVSSNIGPLGDIMPWTSSGETWLGQVYELFGALSAVYGNWAGRHFDEVVPNWMRRCAEAARGLYSGAVTSLTGAGLANAEDLSAEAGRDYLGWMTTGQGPECINGLSVLADDSGVSFLRVGSDVLYPDAEPHLTVRGKVRSPQAQAVRSQGMTSAVSLIRRELGDADMLHLAEMLARRNHIGDIWPLGRIYGRVGQAAENVDACLSAWYPGSGGNVVTRR